MAIKRGNKKWANYEEVAAHVLNELRQHFGIISVQGKQRIKGLRSGTKWEIDAKLIETPTGSFLIVECKMYLTSRISQELASALAWKIQDCGANGGIFVSPLPMQRGAYKIANTANIKHLILRPESSMDRWIAEIGKKLFIGITENVKLSISDAFHLQIFDVNGNLVDERRG